MPEAFDLFYCFTGASQEPTEDSQEPTEDPKSTTDGEDDDSGSEEITLATGCFLLLLTWAIV